jgi:exopolysaccharide biosynthesis polyprenyl glycosylphosphotransferase
MAVMLALLEASVVFGAFLVSALASAGPPGVGPTLESAAVHSLALALCCVAALYFHDLYDLRRVPSFGQSARRLPLAFAAGTVLLLGGHAFAACAIPWGQLLASGVAAAGLVLAVRAAAYRLAASSHRVQRVLLVGGGPLAQELIEEFRARPDLGQRVVGLVDDGAGPLPAGCPKRGGLRDLARVVEELRPHRVIVTLVRRRGRMPLKALFNLHLNGILVEDGIQVYERLTGKVAIEAVTPSSVIFCAGLRASRLDLARALSVPVAAVGLVLLVPLFGLLALAIWLDSRGPVLFAQERLGRGGKRFKLLKFRTMHPASTVTSEWVRDNDTRLTRVGRHLRKFRLDEIPQLLNILRGDMNLVGPRPHPVCNVPLFVLVMRNAPECGEQIPYYALRSMIRPGLTGWAQVRYQYANNLEEEVEKMRYDLYYLKHMSAWLDFRILCETLKIVLRGRESAGGDVPAGRPAARPVAPARRPADEVARASMALANAVTGSLRAAVEFEKPPDPKPVALGRPATQA